MRREYDHEKRILQGPAAPLIVASLITAGSAAHSASKQREAARDADEAAEKARLRAEEEAKRVQEDIRPEGEAATIEFGSGRDTSAGTASDFLVPRTGGTGLGGTGTTGGLGFS